MEVTVTTCEEPTRQFTWNEMVATPGLYRSINQQNSIIWITKDLKPFWILPDNIRITSSREWLGPFIPIQTEVTISIKS